VIQPSSRHGDAQGRPISESRSPHRPSR
jgi:hypothetical protein